MHKCRACAFRPANTAEKAKSLYLSRGAFTEEQRRESPHLVPEDYSEERLLQIGSQLAAGTTYEYDDTRLSKLLAQGEAVRSVNGKALLWWFARFLGPPLAFLAGLWGLVWLLKSLR
jgi:hypothetical protein